MENEIQKEYSVEEIIFIFKKAAKGAAISVDEDQMNIAVNNIISKEYGYRDEVLHLSHQLPQILSIIKACLWPDTLWQIQEKYTGIWFLSYVVDRLKSLPYVYKYDILL